MIITNKNITGVKNNRSKFFIASVFSFFILICIDQVTKKIPESVFLNYNFAFSLPLPVWLMFFIYAAVLFFIFKYLWSHITFLKNFEIIAWVFILSGAISNIVERILLGYVRDWIYIWTGVFNLADIYIILGILFLILNHKNVSN